MGNDAAERLSHLDSVWLRLDLDVLDSGVFPAVGYPQEAGIDWDQLIAIVERPLDSRPPLG